MSDYATAQVPATWLDGQHASPHEVRLARQGTQLCATYGDGTVIAFDVATLEPLTDALAPRPVFAAGHGGQLVLRCAADAAALLLPALVHGRAAAKLPSLRQAVAAVIAIVILVATLIVWLLPRTVEWVADALPVQWEVKLGQRVLRQFDQQLKATSLTEATRTQIEDRFRALTERSGMPDARVMFRSGLGPNAFALPGQVVVVSDELVALLGPSAPLDGVLAHELGHLKHRHGTRALLRHGGFSLLVQALLGDEAIAARLIRDIPLTVLAAAHSRDAEREADAFAFSLLPKFGIPPAALGEALEAISRESGLDPAHSSYLWRHPATQERIEASRERR